MRQTKGQSAKANAKVNANVNAKNVHRTEVMIRRTVNGNLDGSLDEQQAEHIIQRALSHKIGVHDVLLAFRRAVGQSVDGTPISRLVDRVLGRSAGRHDN